MTEQPSFKQPSSEPSSSEQPSVESVCYHRRGAEGTLTLRGGVDIFEAQAVQAAALRALADSKAAAITLEMADAVRLDLSALQILAALRREVEMSGRSFRMPHSEALSAAAKQAGWIV